MEKLAITFTGNITRVFEVDANQLERSIINFIKASLDGDIYFINKEQVLYFMKYDEKKHSMRDYQG